MKSFFFITVFLFSITLASGNVQLPRIFGNHMVLQRDKNIVIWGWASPGEKVSVTFINQTKSVTAAKDGGWKISLNPVRAGGPYQLVVKGKNTITLEDVLVGDVWVCSGQSNMEWTLSNSNNAQQEIREANFATIRHFKIPNTIASQPQQDIRGGAWQVCSPQTAGEFTAVGYFFARELTRDLSIPIGLINSSWGGTHVETWTSKSAFEGIPEFRDMISGMPVLDLDALAKQKMEETLKRVEGIQGRIITDHNEINQWKETHFDDSAWKTMQIPQLWEAQALGDFDGVVWIRKSITISNDDIGKAAILNLGKIDDSDITYVNGVKVGSTTQKYNEKRIYSLAPGILKEGRNIIAVRIEDTGGGGGVHGDTSLVNLTIGDRIISLHGIWSYSVESLLKGTASVGPNSYPTLLFNGMISPILQIGIKGVLWYQGESNAGRAYQYRKAFPLMITDWRRHWNQGDFPFYFVQLATFGADNGNSERGSTWAELREAQQLTLSLPNTGMAVTTDIGDPADIHPRNKQDVGKRLAAIALNKTYGKNIIYGGPVYSSMKTDGKRIVINFQNLGGGLMVKDKYGYLRGFEVAGEDKKFRFAKAFIEGNTVVVYHDDVAEPRAVRFGWADDASDCNLYNKEGFPASPFRTDSWKGITEESKFRF